MKKGLTWKSNREIVLPKREKFIFTDRGDRESPDHVQSGIYKEATGTVRTRAPIGIYKECTYKSIVGCMYEFYVAMILSRKTCIRINFFRLNNPS
jgi:hypothetical protein